VEVASDLESESEPDLQPTSELQSDSEAELASSSDMDPLNAHDHPVVVERERSWSPDFYEDWGRQDEIERLHEEHPDLDSDALGDLHDAQMQDDCDEFGGYCSGGS